MRRIITAEHLDRARRDLDSRLGKAGVHSSRSTLDEAVRLVATVTDRASAMKVADAVVVLLGADSSCSKSVALEAVASALGTANWATLDAGFKKTAKAGKSASSAKGVVETQEDTLSALVRQDNGIQTRGGVTHVEWTYYRPEDCRPEACRLVVSSTSDTYLVTLVEGRGRDPTMLDKREGGVESGDGRKAAEWHANVLAAKWMSAQAPVVASEASRRAAARILVKAGYAVHHTGGGIMLWGKEEDGLDFRLGVYDEVEGQGEDPLAVDTTGTVMVEIIDAEDGDVLFERIAPLAEALAAADQWVASRDKAAVPAA